MTIDAYLEANRERHLEELLDLLRIPSVSTDPDRAVDVARCAEFVGRRMAEAGLDVEVVPTAGHPVAYGQWLGAAGAPTVLIYGHYDVQPPDPLDEWRSPPFEPTIENGNVVARGATDDKGQMYCHLKGIEAHLQALGRLPVNVKVVIEGEEEVGSKHLRPFLEERRHALAADAVIVSDSPMFAPGRPSITIGLKGIVYLEVEARGPSHDLHSGLYGGGVANPANALARMIAGLTDPDGRIAVPGFYDEVRDLTAAERADFRALGHDEDAYRRSIGVSAAPGEPGYTILERIGGRPTLDVNGIWGGYTAPGAKTVIPATASAKISSRLVPDQDPDAIESLIKAHLHALKPDGIELTFIHHHGGSPYLADRDGPAVQAAARALERVWGTGPLFDRSGGSIPIVSDFKEILGIDTVLMGLGLDDDRLHSPNEKFALENFHQGIRASAFLLEELARSG